MRGPRGFPLRHETCHNARLQVVAAKLRVMDKDFILAEIKRTAAENGGKALGAGRFERETGIRAAEWAGRYWARWGDAVTEAGFEPNTFNARFDDDLVLGALALETRRLGRFPTGRELSLRRRVDPDFPSEGVFDRLGSKRDRVSKLAAYCKAGDGFEDVLAIVTPLLVTEPPADRERKVDVPLGFVYLLKSGKHFKLGRTNAFGRRERELAIQLPEKANRVHVIETDDPVGIEQYWHRRFKDRRVRPDAEWFALTKEDVAAFKRRRFM